MTCVPFFLYEDDAIEVCGSVILKKKGQRGDMKSRHIYPYNMIYSQCLNNDPKSSIRKHTNCFEKFIEYINIKREWFKLDKTIIVKVKVTGCTSSFLFLFLFYT